MFPLPKCQQAVVIILISFLLLQENVVSAQQQSVPTPLTESEIERILQRWESMHLQIKTARYQFDRFLLSAKKREKAPHKSIIDNLVAKRLLPLIKSKYTLEDLEKTTKDLVNSKNAERQEWRGNWGSYEVVDNHKQILNSSSFKMVRNEKILTHRTTRLRTPHREIRYNEINRSGTVSKRFSAIKNFSIKDLRFVPDVASLRTATHLEGYVIENERALLKTRRSQIEFNLLTGFVYKSTVFGEPGIPLREIQQFEPQETTTGVEIPAITVTSTFARDSKVMFCFVLIARDVVLDETISEDSFQILVPQGITVSNLSESNQVIGQEKTTENDTDLLRFSEHIPNFSSR